MSQDSVRVGSDKDTGQIVQTKQAQSTASVKLLGGLKLESVHFTRPKPLLLLAYLALEGRQVRRHIAELFWREAGDPMKSLAVALAQLRKAKKGLIITDGQYLEARVTTDVHAFLDRLDKGEVDGAIALYKGSFLDGFYLTDWSSELEEWVYKTRELLAGRLQESYLQLAEQAAVKGDFSSASKHAELIFHLRLDLIEVENLRRLHRLLLANSSPFAIEVAREAESLNVSLVGSTKEARKELQADSQFESIFNLPTLTTPFIGRQQEILAVRDLLTKEPGCRFVTLLGAGGIGKTRLAIELATTLQQSFSNGVCYISLVSISTESGVIAAIAQALNLEFFSHASAQSQLIDYLRDKHLLLVLDNFEHLLEAASVVSRLLETCSDIKLLITSRESLHLQEEWVYRVEGLTFPIRNDQEGVKDYDALILLEQAARRANVRFPIDAKNDYLLRICQMVEGMPLALELAASWLQIMPFESIVVELEKGLDILTTRHKNLPERHQSMRVVLEQSWQFLNPAQQIALKRLSVFRGSFHREDAETITGTSLMTLASLVEKSLLRVSQKSYQLHELLSQFAAEKLDQIPEEAEVYQKHSHYYLRFLHECEKGLNSEHQRDTLNTIAEKLGNIQQAWQWALDHENEQDIAKALGSFYSFYLTRGRLQEGLEWFTKTAEAFKQNAVLSAKLRAREGMFYLFLGDYDKAKYCGEMSLSLTGEESNKAFAHSLLGRVAHFQGELETSIERFHTSIRINREQNNQSQLIANLTDLSAMHSSFARLEKAEELAREALQLCRKHPNKQSLAMILRTLAWPLNCYGKYEEAEVLYQESLWASRKMGDKRGEALAINYLGWSAWCVANERSSQAVILIEDAITRFRDIHDRSAIAVGLADLCLAYLEVRDYDKALVSARESLSIAREIGNSDFVSYALYGLGAAACALNNLEASRTHLSKSIRLALQRRTPFHAANAFFYVAQLLSKESQVTDVTDESRFEKQKQAVIVLSCIMKNPNCWQAFKDRAKKILDLLEQQLSPVNLQIAKEMGEQQSLEDIYFMFLN